METGQSCVIPVIREINEGKMLSALEVSKGFKKQEPTFLATLKVEEEPKIVQAPKVIHRVLEEFKDVMPAKLPKRLPPRREVDHAIELEQGAKPLAFAPYRMAPLELEELREQLKELLHTSYICPSKSPYGGPVLFQMMGRFDYTSTIRHLTRSQARTSIPSLASMTCLTNLEKQGTLPSSI